MADSYLIAATVVAVLVALVAAVAVLSATRRMRQDRSSQPSSHVEEEGRYPEGHWMGVGLGIGIALGVGVAVPIGIAMDNLGLGLALGPGFGLAIGVAIGSSLEQRHRDEIRPLTDRERRSRVYATIALAGVALLGLLALVAGLVIRGSG
jgi:ABC-type Fe3+ transport system permease subunit